MDSSVWMKVGFYRRVAGSVVLVGLVLWLAGRMQQESWLEVLKAWPVMVLFAGLMVLLFLQAWKETFQEVQQEQLERKVNDLVDRPMQLLRRVNGRPWLLGRLSTEGWVALSASRDRYGNCRVQVRCLNADRQVVLLTVQGHMDDTWTVHGVELMEE